MSRQDGVALYAGAMVALIVGVDWAFFRDRFWKRLMVNVGIALVLGAFYLRFLRDCMIKLLEEWRAGRTTEAVVVTLNTVDTDWAQELLGEADAFCCWQGRMEFTDLRGYTLWGSMISYFGPHKKLFREVFGPYGVVR